MRQRVTISAGLGILIGLFTNAASAALESGVYQTLPGATVEEFGDLVPDERRIVPWSATLTFDLNATPPLVTAEVANAVLEGGNPFPLTVRNSSAWQLEDGTYRFDGDYLADIEPSGTQYLFSWEFSTGTNGGVVWNGSVGWAGGHAWYLTISNLALVLLPRLSIARSGAGSVEIVYATNFSDYALQCATSLPGTNWNAVTNAASTNGSRISVIVDTEATQRFYRLSKF